MDKKGFMVISPHFSLILLATRDYRNPNTQWSAEGDYLSEVDLTPRS